jgi:hypothetical protein
MIKRLVWFLSGVVAGVAAVVTAGRRVKRTVGSITPVKVAGRAVDATRSRIDDLRSAFDEGRRAMRDRESELRARRDGRIEKLDAGTSIDPISEGDAILVDGTPVSPSRVIVLRQVDEIPSTSRRRVSRRRP